MDLIEFVTVEFVILIPVLFVLGNIIKITTLIKDKYIPIVLTILGIIFSIGLEGFSVNSILQGVLVAGLTVLGNETVKQLKKVGE